MEPIKDKDVGVLWAEHYPNRSDNVLSTTMVLVLCFIVKERASHGIPYGDWSDKVHHALADFGIPKDQFYEVENQMQQVV
jgi:hypothetical protein